MTKFKVVVDDSITYQRIWKVEIEADDLELALGKARDMAIAGELGAPDSEDEIDNTPYDVYEADRSASD